MTETDYVHTKQKLVYENAVCTRNTHSI